MDYNGRKKKGCLGSVVVIVVIDIVIGAVSGSSGDKKKSTDENNGKVSVSSSSTSTNNGTVKTGDDNGEDDGEVSEEANQVIYDDGDVTITYTGYSAAELFKSATINFLVENNSDKNMTIENFNFNVNGYTLDTWMYEKIPAGKKSNIAMDISSSQL